MAYKTCFVHFLIIATSTGFAYSSNIPDYIHICKRSDRRVERCIKNSIDFMKPKLREGIEELGVPAIEPFHLDNITISSGNSNANFRADLYEVNIHGTSDFALRRLRVNISDAVVTVNVDITFAKLLIDSSYDIGGRILVLPLKGNGKFNGNLTNVYGRVFLKAEIQTNGKTKHMIFTSVDLKLKVQDYEVYLYNLFGGDEILGRAANEAINEAKSEFLDIVLPLVEKESSKIFLNVANQITKRFNYDEIFPA